MAGIFGLLGLDDNDRSYVNNVGQRQVFDAANTWLQAQQVEMMRVYSIFIEQETEAFKERYYLPGGGRLQRRGGQAQSAATKASGSWDVAYPLEDFGAQYAGDDVSMAYMNMQEMQRHLDTLDIQNMNTVRFEILKSIFTNTSSTFVDPIQGSLTIQSLANGDGTLYPPVLGSETEADDTHHIETNYAATAISDTNNPYITGRDDLEEHFGAPTGFGNIVAFVNNAEVAETEDLTDFVPVEDVHIRSGNDANVPYNLPSVPGRIIGRCNGVWIVDWRWVPATYQIFIDLEAPAPLKMRVDPADTGLGRGFQLVSNEMNYPFEQSHYRHRFGVGVGNRLNGVVLELNTGGDYTIPTAYQ